MLIIHCLVFSINLDAVLCVQVFYYFLWSKYINRLIRVRPWLTTVVPNLGSMDPLVVHRRYQGVHRIRNITVNRRGSTAQKG